MNGAWARDSVETREGTLSLVSPKEDAGWLGSSHYSWGRAAIGTGIFAFGLFIYTRVQLLAAPRFSFDLPVDRGIPFVPEMIFAYALFFFFVPLAALVADWERYKRVLAAAVVAAPIGWACFLLVPASFVRPELAGIDSSALRAGFGLLYLVDDSHNTFPSLHVAITWIACLGFRGTRLFWPALATALLICVSTLFVKQHTVLDVLAGTALAAFSLRVSTKTRLADLLTRRLARTSE
jgi:membrane-associated phospholipid phosphatase